VKMRRECQRRKPMRFSTAVKLLNLVLPASGLLAANTTVQDR
jgi:hypothetical protein